MNSTVNIIVPTFQRHKLLDNLLHDIENQSYRNIIVYVCADGEDDYVKNLVRQFNYRSKDLTYKYYYIEHAGGFGATARKHIIDMLNPNDYVCFVDDDNSITNTYVENLIYAIKNNHADMACCKIKCFNQYNPEGFIIPIDDKFKRGQIDPLCIMMKADLAIQNKELWTNVYDSDYDFLKGCRDMTNNVVYVNKLLGEHNFNLKIRVIAICKNEERLLPYFLRHYSFADKIVIYDDGSTDKSVEILSQDPKVDIIHIGNNDKFDARRLSDIKNNCYLIERDKYDWQIIVDIDEFIYHPNLIEKLKEYTRDGITMPKIQGYDMYSKTFPKYNDSICESVKNGLSNKYCNKNIIFNPKKIKINYDIGCHICHPAGEVKYSNNCEIKLLHYKFISFEYFKIKNLERLKNICDYNKKMGWGGHHEAHNNMSEEEFNNLCDKAKNIMDENNLDIIIYNQDPAVYDEVVKDNVYCATNEELSGKSVLDIGANIGTFILLALNKDAKKIVAVEPFPKNYEILYSNFDGNEKVKLINKAVSDKKENQLKMSSENACAHIDENGKIIVEAINLKDCLKNFDENDNELILKIDCEGEEYKIFYSSEKSDILRFKIIYSEIHGKHISPNYKIEELAKYLGEIGYEQHKLGEIYYKTLNEKGELVKYEVLNEIWKFIRKDKINNRYDYNIVSNKPNIHEKKQNHQVSLGNFTVNAYERIVFGKNDKVQGLQHLRYSWARKNVKGNKILDIGCSSGYGAKYFADIPNLDYLGIDRDLKIIEFARENFGDIKGVKFSTQDINTFNFEYYDTVLMFEVLEHLENGVEFSEKIKKHCDCCFFSVPYNEKSKNNYHHKLSNLTEKNFKNFEFFYADGYNNLSKKTTHNCCSLFGKWEKTKNSLYEEKHNFDLLLKQQNENSYEAIMEKNIYNVLQAEVENKIIIDIGANIGLFSIFCNDLNAKQIIALEPNQEIFKNLMRNTIKFPTIKPINYNFNETEKQAICLKDLMDLIQINDNFDLVLKLDYSGGEYNLIENASQKDILKFKTIYTSIYGYPIINKKQEDFISQLKNYGYKESILGHYYHQYFDKINNVQKYDITCQIAKFIRND